ncbi:MAG: hypothetical protein IJ099_00155 [Alphaproteobacteria bacterium]|nr:hypothetical protein [Alphaproteobacteria bacterium]
MALSIFKSLRAKAESVALFRVAVIAFEDNCSINCGRRFADLLKKNIQFEVLFFNEPFSKTFLNLQGRNFFDFIDRGNRILYNTQADILVWGYEEEGNIRLNFQIKNQYTIPNRLSFSLLDSIFLPLNYFTDTSNFADSILKLINGIILAAIIPTTEEQKTERQRLLKKIVSDLAQSSVPNNLSREFMPYIMHMLGKISLYNAAQSINNDNIKVIQNLFKDALNNKQSMRLPIYYGCIYNSLGQLFETAFLHNKTASSDYLKPAISAYQQAQKCLNRNYPYDFGMISYHLALLHFELWKFTQDLQALRDAVSKLREAEKVYSLAQFPQSWSAIENLLGYYLTSLGLSTKSATIMNLAIECYKNRQKIYDQPEHPFEWAQIQEEIGKIYYLLGKQDEDEKLMSEAKNYYLSAQAIYQELNAKKAAVETQKMLTKIADYID